MSASACVLYIYFSAPYFVLVLLQRNSNACYYISKLVMVLLQSSYMIHCTVFPISCPTFSKMISIESNCILPALHLPVWSHAWQAHCKITLKTNKYMYSHFYCTVYSTCIIHNTHSLCARLTPITQRTKLNCKTQKNKCLY